jgi:hypothetical protein
MKSTPAAAPVLNPAETLTLSIHTLRLRIEALVTDIESVSSVSSNAGSGALPGLQAGLRVQIAQLEYFASLAPAAIPEEWLLLIDAIELQATWLADRAQWMRPLSPILALTLSELSWEFSSLMAPTVAARLWLNASRTSQVRMFQAPTDGADGTLCQTAA